MCGAVLLLLPSSVTRFGETSPPWLSLKCFRQFVEGLFAIWQNLKPTLAKICYWGNFLWCKRPNIQKNNLAIWSHCCHRSFVRPSLRFL